MCRPPDEGPSEYQTIPLSKIEDFGVHAKQVPRICFQNLSYCRRLCSLCCMHALLQSGSQHSNDIGEQSAVCHAFATLMFGCYHTVCTSGHLQSSNFSSGHAADHVLPVAILPAVLPDTVNPTVLPEITLPAILPAAVPHTLFCLLSRLPLYCLLYRLLYIIPGSTTPWT